MVKVCGFGHAAIALLLAANYFDLSFINMADMVYTDHMLIILQSQSFPPPLKSGPQSLTLLRIIPSARTHFNSFRQHSV